MKDADQGLGKKIMRFFVNESEDTPPIPPLKDPKKEAVIENATPTIKTKAVELDEKFVSHFVQLLEKANLSGPDYFEFKQALQNMDGLGLPEDKRYLAAWASFKVLGGGLETSILTSSASQYLSILDKDREAFLQDVQKTINERVGQLKLEEKNLEEHNTKIQNELSNLQTKLDENKKRLSQLSGEISDQSDKINTNKDRFEITFQSFVDQIKSDLSKINQYLK
jgi:hypothetical protein|tara:strand:+ start:2466 stop:3137 length:672 start_codon:yes stop_codon:yes gene_type:complete